MSFYADSDLPSPTDDTVRTFSQDQDLGFIEMMRYAMIAFVHFIFELVTELRKLYNNITLNDLSDLPGDP